METIQNDAFFALGDPTRRKILELLVLSEHSIASLCTYFEHVSRTAVVKHLGVLKKAKLVQSRKQGRESVYSINGEPFEGIADWIQTFEPFWNEKLDSLEDYLQSMKENE
ncbi:ArsR/SmtB family transcription factor [Bacillus coahuilensis]|uniref:ArsR/SmtB family transcription factor n=1 Tax=Bacillus coahuilensis TaxID=408580 RepID=UPI0007516A92|nr:metalloregulator ArsR/SmtB family transcription factor [Bacillus coahuilensis]